VRGTLGNLGRMGALQPGMLLFLGGGIPDSSSGKSPRWRYLALGALSWAPNASLRGLIFFLHNQGRQVS